ncbi:hypothetical protein M9H77_07984 [Catharanthus roseus]|uniref:Uncharacterized protein n=1 Tax=Catharanthus roseus TaxID=4058 RepID=A0ACC0BWQ1_CATRO|nr:hypothetical protein M9H77_07984 [Catharanthus roseus]
MEGSWSRPSETQNFLSNDSEPWASQAAEKRLMVSCFISSFIKGPGESGGHLAPDIGVTISRLAPMPGVRYPPLVPSPGARRDGMKKKVRLDDDDEDKEEEVSVKLRDPYRTSS